MTLHDSLTHEGDVDLEVAPGTPLEEIVAGFSHGPQWCGAQSLEPRHPAGLWPLVSGALLSAHAGRPGVAPSGVHLAAIAGPDAGVMIPVYSATTIGGVGAIGLPCAPVVVKDEAIDAHHVTVSPTSPGALRVKDNRSVNGTGVWRLSGDTLAWRGRRRTTTVRVGDVIAIGRSLLEVRGGLANDKVVGVGGYGEAPPESVGFAAAALDSGARWGTFGGRSLRLAEWALRLFPHGAHPSGDVSPLAGAAPDPTRVDGWQGPIAIGGTHAAGLARAVILARGRRPPPPIPLDESWLRWLPPALVGDGPILLGGESLTTNASPLTVLMAEEDRTTWCVDSVSRVGPVVRVSAEAADALSRSRAPNVPNPAQLAVHWADAASLARQVVEDDSCHRIITGVTADDPSVPWEITLRPRLPHTVVTGASRSGKTTLLATIAGALALKLPPGELSLVILCAGAPGALEHYLDLPHVTAAASHVRPSEALSIVDSLDLEAPFTVIMVDDIDALGPDGRAVASRLEAIAMGELRCRVQVVITTQRPTAVLTPTLRASTSTGIALRTTCESDSLELTGISAAAWIPIEAQGVAFVRSAGGIAKVQVALPFADAMPRVRRCDAPLVGAKTLAAAAREATPPTCPEAPARAGQALPAS